ncbi:hypothetical protein KW530_21605 [Vibrio fluvialis]|uniref:hypothetical protein n=1 Tax=Vibrio fluvialis TaxID=676 RepID=UPI001C9C402E|nr:hypothetical protein [Vibrio fluvialis]MBY8267698.1 hypothetical protein [Vibrio fluvialis]
MYFYIEPEVSGGFGDNSVMDTTVHPPKVYKLHYQFDGWLGDELLESFPCFIISEALAQELEREHLSGFTLEDVEVTKSEQFEELYPRKALPKFFWLQVTGSAAQDDLGIAEDHRLVVSESALNTLRKGKIEEADIEEF